MESQGSEAPASACVLAALPVPLPGLAAPSLKTFQMLNEQQDSISSPNPLSEKKRKKKSRIMDFAKIIGSVVLEDYL